MIRPFSFSLLPDAQSIKRAGPILIALAFVLVIPAVCQACPTCKEGIADGTNHANVVRGYFWSIVFMMSMPFLIFGGMAAYLYAQVRKARQSDSQIRQRQATEAIQL